MVVCARASCRDYVASMKQATPVGPVRARLRRSYLEVSVAVLLTLAALWAVVPGEQASQAKAEPVALKAR